MFAVFLNDVLFRDEAFNIFSLHFIDHLDHPVAKDVHHGQDASLSDRRVRAIKCKIVGHMWRGYAQIRQRVFLVEIPKILSIGNDRKSRYPSGVETCGEDDGIDFNLVAVGIDEALFCNFIQ